MQRKTAHNFSKSSLSRITHFHFGFTLVEVLVVVALIAVLASAFLASANYLVQIQKGKDSKVKSDLSALKVKMEDYYGDNNRYPAVTSMDECKIALGTYINFIPCDPKGDPYYYETDSDGTYYRIYAKLQNIHDPIIEALGCSNGCGPGTPPPYNYGISSSNVGLVGGAARCVGAVAPSCGGPDLYCGQIGTCCPGVNYVMSCSGGYWCCPL